MGSGGTEVPFNGGMPQGWRDLPIDGEWLESRGFERRTSPMGKTYWIRGFMSFYKQVEFCACPLQHIKTRQQMLDAIDVLLASADRDDEYEEYNPQPQPEIDQCGNEWYPFDIARNWSIGVPVVVRVTSRETGLFMYSIASRWQAPGINTFGDSSMFLMLDRMPQ